MIPYFEAIKKYGVFRGRARPWEYLGFWIVNLLVFIGIFMLGMTITGGDDGIVALLLGFYYLAVLVPGVAVTVRRLHDRGRSGWWYLLFFIPIIGQLVILYWLVSDGQPGSNRYGPNPSDITK